MQTIITSKQSWLSLNVRELLSYRDLFYFLAWRDIKVRYKQTAIGVLWAFFVPLISMVVFTFFFGRLAGIQTGNTPYPLFVFVGLLFWTFFSQALSNASNSLVASQEIVKKIYFPKLMLPASSIFVSLIDFAIATLIFVGLCIYYRLVPGLATLYVFPILVIITYVASLGLGLFLAAVNVKYRDVRYIIPFFLQLMLFVTPVIYASSVASEKWYWLLALNPMTPVIDVARTVLLEQGSVEWWKLGLAALVSLAFFVFGLGYFRKTERYFADVI